MDGLGASPSLELLWLGQEHEARGPVNQQKPGRRRPAGALRHGCAAGRASEVHKKHTSPFCVVLGLRPAGPRPHCPRGGPRPRAVVKWGTGRSLQIQPGRPRSHTRGTWGTAGPPPPYLSRAAATAAPRTGP